ncbi:hypothetical protein P280DRAFT_475553 [Massarina eburnea CBS 473.64]|uniref:F-box domain-containing protein n=1 Tax=Massarina eburnea CBS 473.64 TaxID=1395130 RepID=A0A6A6SID0_9PLEO|nr:hypothetical protein P280DRAFT_475553 [Massarina eburnea CBS 473.64]
MASDVLSTTELLELILTHLPLPDILTSAQRVCRTWHSVISTSPTLQTMLFFRPVLSSFEASCPTTTTTTHPHPFVPAPNFTVNPFLATAFPFLLNPNKSIPVDEQNVWKKRIGLIGKEKHDVQGTVEDKPKALFFSEWAVAEKQGKGEKWRRKEASWRKMFVSRPVVKRVVVRETRSGMMQVVQETVLEFAGRGSEDADIEEVEEANVENSRCFDYGGGKGVLRKNDVGLRWGPLHDYFYSTHCTGDQASTVNISILPRWPVDWDHLLQDASTSFHDEKAVAWEIHDEKLDARYKGDRWRERGYEGGVTMFLGLGWGYTCDWEEEERWEEFRSEAWDGDEAVFGGLAQVAIHMWD